MGGGIENLPMNLVLGVGFLIVGMVAWPYIFNATGTGPINLFGDPNQSGRVRALRGQRVR